MVWVGDVSEESERGILEAPGGGEAGCQVDIWLSSPEICSLSLRRGEGRLLVVRQTGRRKIENGRFLVRCRIKSGRRRLGWDE